MSRIYWDTMLFVYWIEDHPTYAPRVAHILKRMNEREDELYTSAFALAELLVGPRKRDAKELIQRIEEVFDSPFIKVLPFTRTSASHYARIRSTLGVSPADAIHLACAAEAGTDLFLTNDDKLVGKAIPGIQFIAGISTDVL